MHLWHVRKISYVPFFIGNYMRYAYQFSKTKQLQTHSKLEQFHKYEGMQMERYEKMHRNGQEG